MKRGRYFPKFLDFLQVFTSRESDLLLHIMSCGKLNADLDGFVLATTRFLETGLGIGFDIQERLLARLERRGVIEVKMLRRKRHIRVDCRKIEELIRQENRRTACHMLLNGKESR
jgi:hypothetical protein